MSRPSTWAGRAIDGAIVLVVLAAAGAGWHGVLATATWVPATVAGLLFGAALAAWGAQRGPAGRRPAWALALVLVPLHLLVGVPVATGSLLPSPSALRLVLTGTAQAWKQVLTLPVPVPVAAAEAGALGTAPLILALVTALVAVSAVLRARRALPWVTAATLLVLVTTAVLGPGGDVLAMPRALVVVAGLCLLLARRRARGAVDGGHRPGPRRLVAASGVVAVGLAAAAVAAPALADQGRWAARQDVVPPFVAYDYASPLSGFRQWVKAPDAVVAEVTGLPAGARLELATFDAFDGTVWNVAGAVPMAGSGRFDATTPDADGETEVNVTVGAAYRGVWVPTAGAATGLEFSGDRATALANGLRHNAASANFVDLAGIVPGDEYSFRTTLRSDPTADELAAYALTPATVGGPVLPDPVDVPAGVAAAATANTAAATTPGRQAADLAAALQQGYYSDGADGAAPSAPGHGAARLEAMLGQEELLGDDEQYASLMALQARALGLPARVVMGFVVPEPAEGTATVTGADVAAWAEVHLPGVGWTTFVPTPPEDRVPPRSSPRPQPAPQAQLAQPPSAPQQPDDESTSTPQDREDDGPVGGTPWRLLLAVGLPVLLVALFLVGVLGAKSLRRNRRRHRGDGADRVLGGWRELLDAGADLGLALAPRQATRVESVAGWHTDVRPAVTGLARRADAGAFSPQEPTQAEVEAFWADVDTAVGRVRAQTGRGRRLWAALDPRTLLRPRAGRPTPVRTPGAPRRRPQP